jgi:ADP-heptose:LPS heptosyltransferase
MCVPVIAAALEQNPQLTIQFVSRPFFKPMFAALDRLEYIDVDLDESYKGMQGLYRLYKVLKHYDSESIADLHQVLRTHMLNAFFYNSGKEISKIDKGRDDKKALTAKKNKKLVQLDHMTERYADVFRALNVNVKLDHQLRNYLNDDTLGMKNGIGIAPFAFHKQKEWPLEKMHDFIHLILMNTDEAIYLFGGGKEEMLKLKELTKQTKSIVNVSNLPFPKQLAIMQQLRVMVSMDSANMHLASLAGVPCVSIWLATHPYAGFLGYGQKEEDAIQLKELDCRPCSVYGNEDCWRKDNACFEITPEMIWERVKTYL